MRKCINCRVAVASQNELLCSSCKRALSKSQQKEVINNYARTTDDTAETMLILTVLSTYGSTSCSGSYSSHSCSSSSSYSSDSSSSF